MPIQLRLPGSERRLSPVAVDDLVRVGRDHDGGYILPLRMIEAADSVLALGLSDDWSFEEGLVRHRPELPVHGYDHTISRKIFARMAWIGAARLALMRGSLHDFQRRRETLRSYDRFFTDPNRHFHQKITNRPDKASECDLTGALDRLGGSRAIVKMDIEGSEYRVVDQLAANAARIVGACVEFHDIEPLRIVFNEAVDLLLVHYVICHLHPNNYGKIADDGVPDVLEITLVNRSLVSETIRRRKIYIPELDQPNDPGRPELVLAGP